MNVINFWRPIGGYTGKSAATGSILQHVRAIVTGGAGFIGSTLVDALQTLDFEVLVLDNLARGSIVNLDDAFKRGAQLTQLDVRDASAVGAAFAEFQPQLVFHLAAQIDVRSSMGDPGYDASVNVLGAINVFAASLVAGVQRVVNTSTGGAIYGETSVLPTPETVAPRPISAYGVSKLTAEQYARWFWQANGLDVVTLRYGNVYGPRQDPRGEAGVIAIFCDRLLSGRRPTVFGDGTQTRDYVFVNDVAEANIAAALSTRLPHRVYNVGTGIEVTVLELVNETIRVARTDPDLVAPEFLPARPGEVLRSCLDVRRARNELGLPAPTPLNEGLRRTRSWMRELVAS